MEWPQGFAEGRVADAVRTGKDALLRHVVKAGYVVIGPCTLGVSDTSPTWAARARTAKW